MKFTIKVFLGTAVFICFAYQTQGHLRKFVSDGSDFVIGTDRTRTTNEGDSPKTCIKFDKTAAERLRYRLILVQELRTNQLFRQGWEKAKSYHKPAHGLTENEALAVVTYTLEYPRIYPTFNRQTRELGPSNPKYEFKAMYYFLSMATDKLSPKSLGIHPYKVYRGVTYTVTDAFVGQPFHFKNFASTSEKRSVAEAFMGGATGSLFIIENTYQGGKIAEFSFFPGEAEVLIPACENFLVVKIVDNVAKKRNEIYLQSLDISMY